MTPKRAITSLRVKNFKAVHDSGTLTPGGLTVFIGNNGAGKSSVIEALRFLRALSRSTLDQSLKEFGSYADLRWKGGVHRGRISPTDPDKELHPLEITVHGHLGAAVHQASVRLSGLNQGKVGFDHETLRRGATTLTRTVTAPTSLCRSRPQEGARTHVEVSHVASGLYNSRPSSSPAPLVARGGATRTRRARGVRPGPRRLRAGPSASGAAASCLAPTGRTAAL